MTLSAQEEKLYTAMRNVGVGIDVPVLDLYVLISSEDVTHREAQQRLGARVSRINSKIEGLRIVPGALKRTYRLAVVR